MEKDQPIPDVEAVLAISDPGEVDRDTHSLIDRVVINFGNIVSWLFPILMIVIVSQVLLRRVGHNQAWLDDAQWWIYGFAMLTAFGYAIATACHIRVDIFHQFYSEKKKARIEAFAIGWLLLPFVAIMVDVLAHYAWQSAVSGEGSASPNGLHRLYLLKATLPILFLLAGVAAWSRFRFYLAKFTDTGLATQLLWLAPTMIFVFWRLVHYTLYWIIFFTHSEIKPRRITREPIFDYSLLIAVSLVMLIFVVGRFARHRRGV